MALDLRNYGKKLTLEKCASLYEDFIQILTPLPVKIGVKGRIVVLPDEIWVTQWQADTVFTRATWIDIRIVVRGDHETEN